MKVCTWAVVVGVLVGSTTESGEVANSARRTSMSISTGEDSAGQVLVTSTSSGGWPVPMLQESSGWWSFHNGHLWADYCQSPHGGASCVRRVPAARFGEPAATALDAAQVGEAFQPDRLPTSDFAAGSAPRIAGLAATPCVSHGAPGTTRLSGTGLSDSGRRSAARRPRQSSIQSSPWTANMRNLRPIRRPTCNRPAT